MKAEFENELSVDAYTKQALDFLNATSTSLTIEFKKYGSMPWDKSGEKRNIFTCTLKNKLDSYKFDFGNSLHNSNREVSEFEEAENIEVYAGVKFTKIGTAGVKFTVSREEIENLDSEFITDKVKGLLKDVDRIYKNYNGKLPSYKKEFNNFSEGAAFNCVLNAVKRKITDLKENKVLSKNRQGLNIISPSEYDVLSCLTKYDPETFEDFCDAYGYDTDSRSAERTYKAVVKEWQAIEKLFSPEQIEQLQEIQ